MNQRTLSNFDNAKRQKMAVNNHEQNKINKKIKKQEVKNTKLKTNFDYDFQFKIQTLDYYQSQQCKIILSQLFSRITKEQTNPPQSNQSNSLSNQIKMKIQSEQQQLQLNKHIFIGSHQLVRKIKRKEMPQIVIILFDPMNNEQYSDTFSHLYLNHIKTIIINKSYDLELNQYFKANKINFISFFSIDNHHLQDLLQLQAMCSLYIYTLINPNPKQ